MAHRFPSALVLCGLAVAAPVQASTFSNINGVPVEFPAGVASFADEVVSFTPGLQANPSTGAIEPLAAYRRGANTLGPPDMDVAKSIACFASPNDQDCGFVSLGVGGTLVVKFTDNLLTGGGTAAADLWIFDMGTPDAFLLDISTDGTNWFNVGTVSGTPGVDIDAYGHGPGTAFAYVRLQDAPGGQPSGPTVGADIDAIGAISTTVVPLPASGLLLAGALAVPAWRRLSRAGGGRARAPAA